MRLVFDFEIVDMGNEIIAVPVGNNAKEISGVLKLNKTGLEVLQLLKEGRTSDDIITLLSSKYDNEHIEIKRMVEKYIDNLVELGLLFE